MNSTSSTETEIYKTEVDLNGLFEVLSHNLYSTPVVAVRELVQNAHDACIRRQLETDDVFEPEIRIFTRPETNLLVITDNGAGLTRSEIRTCLATIGSGYTRQMRRRAESAQLIGYYGLGFLTAYVVARKVVVETRSCHETDKTWKFVSTNGRQFTVGGSDRGREEPGSSVSLYLEQAFTGLADASVLREVLQRYCCLLPVAIYLNDETTPLNSLKPPWRYTDAELSPLRLKKLRLEFAAVFEPLFEPMCTIAVGGTEGAGAGFHGLLWIHEGTSYTTTDNRSVSVFIRNMFITDKARDFLPDWAGFVSAVIESDCLLPTASREDVQYNEIYAEIAAQVHEQLISGLIDLKNTEPETFRRVLRRHNEHLLGAVLEDQRLFDALADELRLPTSEGDLTVRQILAQGGRQLNVALEQDGGYEMVISRVLKKPVIYGYRYAAHSFAARYAAQRDIVLAVLGTREGNSRLFERVQIDSSQQARLELLRQQAGEQVIAVRFQPDFIPLVSLADEEALLKQRIESDQAQERISKAALALARAYTGSIEVEAHYYLYVNMDSALIRLLLDCDMETGRLLATMLRGFMFSVGGHGRTHRAADLAQELARYSAALIELVTGTGR